MAKSTKTSSKLTKKESAKVDLWIFVLVTSILGGVLLIVLIAMTALFTTGVVSFNQVLSNTTYSVNGTKLVDNPNPRVSVKGKLVEINDLEFYLPYKFKEGNAAGGESESTHVYNLENDSGWATVTVYVEKTNKNPGEYLLSKSRFLELNNSEYYINGQSWVEAENGSSLAYATRHGDYVYAIIYTVKLDSETTSEAMSMIPKTLYFKKIYQ